MECPPNQCHVLSAMLKLLSNENAWALMALPCCVLFRVPIGLESHGKPGKWKFLIVRFTACQYPKRFRCESANRHTHRRTGPILYPRPLTREGTMFVWGLVVFILFQQERHNFSVISTRVHMAMGISMPVTLHRDSPCQSTEQSSERFPNHE